MFGFLTLITELESVFRCLERRKASWTGFFPTLGTIDLFQMIQKPLSSLEFNNRSVNYFKS